MSRLVLPDTVTVVQEAEHVLGEHTGRPLGRGVPTTYVVKAQLETVRERRTNADGVRSVETSVQVVFDRRALLLAGYSPRPGDRIQKVQDRAFATSRAVSLWLVDVPVDGAGALLVCSATDRLPQR